MSCLRVEDDGRTTRAERQSVHVQLTPEAVDQLERVMAETGVSRSSVLELVIRKYGRSENFV